MTSNLICAIVFICLMLAFVILELCTVELVSIWFVIGSLFAFIFARIPQIPFYVSIIIFFVISLASLFLLRPLFKKRIPQKRKFNSEGFIGKEYPLLKEIKNDELGEIKIGSVIYNAKSKDETPIEKGKEVIITSIEGNTLVVELKKEG